MRDDRELEQLIQRETEASEAARDAALSDWAFRRDRGRSGPTEVVDVTAVRVLARYFVELTLANGEVRVIDLEPFLRGPMFEPVVADYDLFRQVAVDTDAGTIVWPNGADLSPRTLYAESKPVSPE